MARKYSQTTALTLKCLHQLDAGGCRYADNSSLTCFFFFKSRSIYPWQSNGNVQNSRKKHPWALYLNLRQNFMGPYMNGLLLYSKPSNHSNQQGPPALSGSLHIHSYLFIYFKHFLCAFFKKKNISLILFFKIFHIPNAGES